MRLACALPALLLVGCGGGGVELPEQSPEQVVEMLTSGVRACTAGLTSTGPVDQAALARTGWRVVERTISDPNSPATDVPLETMPTLRPWQLEVTLWEQDGIPNQLALTRYGSSGGSPRDSCMLDARTERGGGVDRVVALMASRLGRPAREGEQPRGGDFLTPRFDTPRYAYYWPLPRHDLYVSKHEDRYVRLEVVAMGDRASLDRYSPDRPEARIPMVEGTQ